MRISTQVQQIEPDWDEMIRPGDADFGARGLRRASAARLSYLYAAGRAELVGTIGRVDEARVGRLRARLAARLSS